jgi:hypothetical protein
MRVCQTPMNTIAGNRGSSAFTRGHSPDAARPGAGGKEERLCRLGSTFSGF